MASPIKMELGMVVSGIVYNNNDASTASRTGESKVFEKAMERHGVKPFLLSLENQFSIAQANSSKVPHTLARRMVQQHRILFFRGDPHETTRSVLLKMDFISRPQIGPRIRHDLSEFFYMPPEVQDRHERSEAAVCADESQRT